MLDFFIFLCYYFTMKIEFNTEQIQTLLSAFGLSTGLSISLYDENYTWIASGNKERPFCPKIKVSKTYNGECMMNDQLRFIEAEKKKSAVLYTCHAGLTEMVTPLIYDDIVIGYIIIGQFIDEERNYADESLVQIAATKFDLNYEELLYDYQQSPVLSAEHLSAANLLLHHCIQSLLYNQLIRLQNNLLPQRIKEYILNNLDLPLSVESLCKKFFVSQKKLYNLFRDEFHTTVKDFILKERIRKAKKLLVNSDMTLIEISDKTGFTDYSYFIRIFKKRIGLSPLKYRKVSKEMSNSS